MMKIRLLVGAAGCVLLCGCVSYGPPAIERDRFDYNEAISESWQTQVLQGIVKLRYSEWPVFLEINQIATQYTWEQTGVGKFILKNPFGPGADQAEGALTVKRSERPVMIYKPVTGAEYMKWMLTPADPGAVLALIYTGWPADTMLQAMAHSINGRRNIQLERGMQLQPNRVFARFIRIMASFQQQDALVMDVVAKPQGKGEKSTARISSTLQFRDDLVDDETRAELNEVKQLMGLNPETNEYSVVWGAISPNPNTLAIETRSVLQVMVVLSAHVDVLEKELKEGRVSRLRPIPKENRSGLEPLMHVSSGPKAPKDAYAKCQYRDRWFWLSDTDLTSKRTFTYLTLLLTLGATGGEGGAQLVITTN